MFVQIPCKPAACAKVVQTEKSALNLCKFCAKGFPDLGVTMPANLAMLFLALCVFFVFGWGIATNRENRLAHRR
jgi:hypothetical protein